MKKIIIVVLILSLISTIVFAETYAVKEGQEVEQPREDIIIEVTNTITMEISLKRLYGMRDDLTKSVENSEIKLQNERDKLTQVHVAITNVTNAIDNAGTLE
jgi:Na+-transporting NADH:ubiquinone oxidoreductase subunit NqrC